MKLPRLVDLFHRDHAKALEERGGILTIVSIITKTAAKTFDGPAIMVTQTANSVVAGGAVLQSRESSAVASTTQATEATITPSSFLQPTTAAATTSQLAKSSAAKSTSNSSPSSPSSAASSSLVTAAPSTSPASGGAAAASAAATKEAKSTESGGMTGGAKAGLAFGIIFLIAALLAGYFFLYRRQKKKAAAGDRLDDEKFAMARPDALPSHPGPMSGPAPDSASQGQMAPRLILRPVTQFNPHMSSALPPAAGVAAGLTAARNVTSFPANSESAERHDNNPANPFGNHAQSVSGSLPSSVAGGPASMAGSSAVVPAMAADAQQRPTSPREVEAADFPLPVSGPSSPKPLSVRSGTLDDATTPSASTTAYPAAPLAGATSAAIVAGAVAADKSQNALASPGVDNVHRVQLDFKPSMDDELDIRAGQLVRMLHEYDDGWAQCIRLDRSQQGVVPRTCLSKYTVKPRPQGPPQGRGAPARPGPGGPGYWPPPPNRGPPGGPMGPGSGRNSPAHYSGGRASPAMGGRASPAPGPLSSGGRPNGRARAASNAAPYAAYNPQQGALWPAGRNGSGQLRPSQRPVEQRRRSNSMSNIVNSPPRVSPLGPSRLPIAATVVPARKPVPGQAVE